MINISASLQSRYAEPWRHYHTVQHIYAMFAELDHSGITPQDRDAVELAIQYHDAVYDPMSHNNEQRSAELMKFEQLGRVDLYPLEIQDKAWSMIMMTRHTCMPHDTNQRLVCDLDLAILGKAPEVFQEYEHQIRKEYQWVEKTAYGLARAVILRGFLARPFIYGTEYFRARYEQLAKINLAWSIRQLDTCEFLGGNLEMHV